jgi:hypothetical protein
MSYIIAKRAKATMVGRRSLQASTMPVEHVTEESALAEARRLAQTNVAYDFYVYQAIRAVGAKVQLEETVIR